MPAEAFLDYVSSELLAAAEALVIELDFLPLALDQAGAYIEEVGCYPATYLELYHGHCKALLQRRGHTPSDHPDAVATTWSLSFQLIEQRNPLRRISYGCAPFWNRTPSLKSFFKRDA